jgi:hypothetical protein
MWSTVSGHALYGGCRHPAQSHPCCLTHWVLTLGVGVAMLSG